MMDGIEYRDPATHRGICFALVTRSVDYIDVWHRWLRLNGLDPFPVQGLLGVPVTEQVDHYHDTTGEWTPDTPAGLVRLTLWGAFWADVERGLA